jgi:hypothetical protein
MVHPSGLDRLPNDERGQRIIRWGIDHAWLAGPANPVLSARRWCRCWAPWLSTSQVNSLVEAARWRGKRWTRSVRGHARRHHYGPIARPWGFAISVPAMIRPVRSGRRRNAGRKRTARRLGAPPRARLRALRACRKPNRERRKVSAAGLGNGDVTQIRASPML